MHFIEYLCQQKLFSSTYFLRHFSFTLNTLYMISTLMILIGCIHYYFSYIVYKYVHTKVKHTGLTLVRANLTRVTSPPTQLQADPVLSSLYLYFISFSSFTFPDVPYRIFFLYLPRLPCHFYIVVIEQQQPLIMDTTVIKT